MTTLPPDRRSAGPYQLLLIAALTALVMAGSSSAAAQDAELTASVRITVSHLTGVLGPGSVAVDGREDPRELEPAPHDLVIRALIENDGEVALESLRLVIEIHPPARTRGLLRQALEGRLLSRPVHVNDPAIRDGNPLEPGEVAGVSATFGRDQIPWADGAGGVHPVRISVTRGTDVLDEVITAVVWQNETPPEPMTTTFVWPLDAAPWRTVGGSYPSGADREVRPGGRLDDLIRALERSGSPPVVPAPAAHLLEDLSDRTEGFTSLARQDDGTLESRTTMASSSSARLSGHTLQRLRELATAMPYAPVSGAYAAADLVALNSGSDPLRELAAEAAVDGRRRLQRQLGRAVDATAHLVRGPTDDAVLDLVPGETLLLPYATTTEPPLGADPSLAPAIRRLRTPSGRLLTALVSDPYLEDALSDLDHPAGPAAAAQRVIAESALAYFEAPTAAGRTLLLMPPPTWHPSPGTADLLLKGLREANWLRLSTPSDQVEQGQAGGELLELAGVATGPFQGDLAAMLDSATTGLTAATAALPEGATQLDGRSASELRDDLLRASSHWYREATGEAESIVREVQRAIDATFGSVEVATGSVTLTSDTGQIPVTLQRSRGGPVTVAVEVASQGRLLWPEGRRSEPLVLEEGASQTVSFSTQARSTGTFPVTVRVTDPTGAHELARTRLSVRSTAISGPALSAIGGVILVLLLLGALRRRDRRPRLEVVE